MTAERIGRSIKSIRRRLAARGLPSSPYRGRMSLTEVERITGYPWGTLRRAIAEIPLRPVRVRHPSGYTRWSLTQEHVDELVAYLERDRTSPLTIAIEVGISHRSAYRAMDRLGIDRTGGDLSEEDAERLRVELGKVRRMPPPDSTRTVAAIAIWCGVHRSSAYKHARRLGLQTGERAELTAEDADVLRSSIMEGRR